VSSSERACSRRAFLGLVAGFSLHAWTGRARSDDAACAPLRRAIPKTGETLPAVGLGTWQGLSRAHLDVAREVIARFVDLGGALIDTAPMYGDAEIAIGDVVRALDVRRRLFLATKVLSTGREAGREQMRKILRLPGRHAPRPHAGAQPHRLAHAPLGRSRSCAPPGPCASSAWPATP
jgi:hypothetical protein